MKNVLITRILLVSILFLSAPVFATAGGTWAKCACNPVLSPTPGSWDSFQVWAPHVLFDGSTYHMWYSGNEENVFPVIGYASSSDGTSWVKAPAPILIPTNGGWDDNQVNSPSVIKDGSVFKMWYVGRASTDAPRTIGYATSTDGMAWTKHSNNPVLTGTSGGSDGSSAGIRDPWVIKDGSMYKMWYRAAPEGGTSSIHYAESGDGISWTKKGSVLSPSLSGWDAGTLYAPAVILDGGVYKMWYTGANEARTIYKIGYAYSTDGMSWTRYSGNPVLSQGASGSWDSYSSVDNGAVILVGSMFKLYYTADQMEGGALKSTKIGYAEAPSATVIPEFPGIATLVIGVLVAVALIVTRPLKPIRKTGF